MGGFFVMNDLDKRELASKLGVECYQIFSAEDTVDGYRRIIDFAIGEFKIGAVAVLESLGVNNIEGLRDYCTGKRIDFSVHQDIDPCIQNNIILFPHVCRITDKYLKVKKLIKKCHEIGAFAAIDISDTFGRFNIDFKQLDVDFCILDRFIIISDKAMLKSYKYIDNKYFVD